MSGGDEKSFPVIASEGAIGDHVGRNGNKPFQLTLLTDDIDTGREFVYGLGGERGEIEAGRYIEIAVRSQAHPVGAAIGSPVEELLPTSRIRSPIIPEVESPELSIVSRVVVGVVRNKQKLLIFR